MIREWRAEIERIMDEAPIGQENFPPYPTHPHPDESMDDYLDRWWAQLQSEGIPADREVIGEMMMAFIHNGDAMDNEAGLYGAAFIDAARYDAIRENVAEMKGLARLISSMGQEVEALLDPPTKEVPDAVGR